MADTALTEATNNQINAAKQEIYDYVKIRLGDGMVEVELDPRHLENAKRSKRIHTTGRSNSCQ